MEILRLFLNNYYVATFGVIAAVIFSVICSIRVKSTFSKFNRVRTGNGLTAYDAARQILDANGLQGVQITRCPGNLTDHFDPRTNTVALSDSVYGNSSVGAIGVAAHECGHAIQYARGYGPIKLRNLIYPLVSFCQMTWMWIFLIGCAISLFPLTQIAIVFFAVVVFFQLVTLPVEFNASNRAISTLYSMQILQGQELSGAKKVLKVAAMTYVASLLTSIMQLLRLIAGTRRR